MTSIEQFVSEVELANGNPIPLDADNALLNGLHLTVRQARNPLIAPDPNALSDFYAWSRRWSWKGDEMPQTSSVVVDAYIKEGVSLSPIGHMDWWLLDEYANGGGNEHSAFSSSAAHEIKAAERWNDTIAFKVDPEYQGNGLGSLMLATSSVVLPAVGATRFYSGGLLEPAKKTYARFGITEDSWPRCSRTWSDRSLPVETLSEHPRVEVAIGQFTTSAQLVTQ